MLKPGNGQVPYASHMFGITLLLLWLTCFHTGHVFGANTCFGKSSTDISACGGKGLCGATDVCTCFDFTPSNTLYSHPNSDGYSTFLVSSGFSTLYSSDNRIELKMQTDGNLVMYEAGVAQWSSNSYGSQSPYQTVLYTDGSLVVKGSFGYSKTLAPACNRAPPYRLTLQNNRDIVLYDSEKYVCWKTVVTDTTKSINVKWGGLQCSEPICYGINGGNSSVCGGKGACSNPNSCSCFSGYSGATCQYFSCNGIPSNSTSVCSSKGQCLAPDSCKCDSGYYGQQCQNHDCYGVINNSSMVCSGHGFCTQPNECQCTPNKYWGDQCETTSCFSIMSNSTNPKPCSGNGNCVSFDNCSCVTGSGVPNYHFAGVTFLYLVHSGYVSVFLLH